MRLPGRKRRPSAGAVGRRALCLGAVATAASAARTARRGDATIHAEVAEVESRLHEWLRKEDLRSELSPSERSLLDRPLASWPEDAGIQASWRSEAAGVLLWAVSALPDLPSYDTQIESERVLLPFGEPVAPFLARCSLRPPEEIERARDVAELWHWRSRTRTLQQSVDAGPLPEGWTLSKVVAASAERGHAEGLFGPPIERDFPARGKAYRDLDDEEFAEVASIAVERHFALNWLCGYSRSWDATRTDT